MARRGCGAHKACNTWAVIRNASSFHRRHRQHHHTHARTHVRTNTSHRQAPTRRQRSAPASEATAAVLTASALPPNESLKRRVLSRPWSREIVKSSRYNLSALRQSVHHKQTNKQALRRPSLPESRRTDSAALRRRRGCRVRQRSCTQCTNVRARTHTRARTHAANEQ